MLVFWSGFIYMDGDNKIMEKKWCPASVFGDLWSEDGNQRKWDLRFLNLSKYISAWSLDPSTKVGAVITYGKRIVSVGFNGLPQKLPDDPEILNDREAKYEQVVHGEINALIFSGKTNLVGHTLYTYPFLPCSRCCSMFLQTDISRVVSLTTDVERWQKNLKLSLSNFKKAGVEVVVYQPSDLEGG